MEPKIEGLLSPEGPDGGHEYPREIHALGLNLLVQTRAESTAIPIERRLQSLRSIEQRLQREPALPLRALIFHCSRCGSTLLAQLLAAEGSHRVFAEPKVLNKFLWKHSSQLAAGGMTRELRTFLEAFGLSPSAKEQGFAIKLSSPALLFLPALRAAFPGVPFVYLLREPTEVVASLASYPPFFLSNSRALFAAAWGCDPESAQTLSPTEWYAWYVDRNLRLARQHAHEFSEVIDHKEASTRFLPCVNRLTSGTLSPNAPEITRLLGRHSKATAHGHRPGAVEKTALSSLVTQVAGQAYQLWRDHLPDVP